MDRDKEVKFLKALRDCYYVDSSLTYSAKQAGVSLREALDYTAAHGMPMAGDPEDDKIGLEIIKKRLGELRST